jgi:hypothetical protein
MNVYHEIHWMNDVTGQRGILHRTFYGGPGIYRNAWRLAKAANRKYPHRRHWVKTRPVPAQPLEAA